MKREVKLTDLVSQTVNKFASDIEKLGARKDNALSAFRKTATELAEVNKEIDTKVGEMNTLIDYITDEKSYLQKQMADNQAIRNKILEIIGE